MSVTLGALTVPGGAHAHGQGALFAWPIESRARVTCKTNTRMEHHIST